MGILVWGRTIEHENMQRTREHSAHAQVDLNPNLFTPPTTLTLHHNLSQCMNQSSGQLKMWTDLDEKCHAVSSVRFCGGQHLDHIIAFSADNAPVLELCRSVSTQVLICVHGSETLKLPKFLLKVLTPVRNAMLACLVPSRC